MFFWVLAYVHAYVCEKENHENLFLKIKPNRMVTLADIGIICENTHLPLLKSPMVNSFMTEAAMKTASFMKELSY